MQGSVLGTLTRHATGIAELEMCGEWKIAQEVALTLKYYALQYGRRPGMYDNRTDCKKQVHGFCGARNKSFIL